MWYYCTGKDIVGTRERMRSSLPEWRDSCSWAPNRTGTSGKWRQQGREEVHILLDMQICREAFCKVDDVIVFFSAFRTAREKEIKPAHAEESVRRAVFPPPHTLHSTNCSNIDQGNNLDGLKEERISFLPKRQEGQCSCRAAGKVQVIRGFPRPYKLIKMLSLSNLLFVSTGKHGTTAVCDFSGCHEVHLDL